jgi:hypothetical protein
MESLAHELGVFDRDHGGDSPSWAPTAFQLRSPRGHDREKIIEDSIGHVLVKNTLVAKPLQIKLETLELNTLLVRDISKGESSEIWLTRFRTDRREFRTNDLDKILAVWIGIIKALQLFDERGPWHNDPQVRGKVIETLSVWIADASL